VTDPRLPGGLSCDEVRDLAASFVLDALPEAEMAAVREHLATCPEPHPEIAELSGVVPVLQAGIARVEPPAARKDRIMAAAAADLEARRRSEAVHEAAPAPPPVQTPVSAPPAAPVAEPTPIERTRARWSWAVGIAAVLAIVLLGAWNLSLRSELDSAQRYQQQVAAVLDAARVPGALTAVMTTTTGQGPNGIAAVTPDGEMRIAMRDLAPTTGDEVYEAWVILPDTAPAALGDFQVGASGSGYLEAAGLPTQPGMVLALTREPGPGAMAPSSDPVSVGTATATG
jgi:Anti-sigma-K factor rskA, C-terminal/Putative zinc-finger